METPFLQGAIWKMGNGYNLLLGRFQLGIRGESLTMRTISHWNCLSREMVGFPTLLTFMTQLERVQCHLVQNLLLSRLDQMILESGILWLDGSKYIFGVDIVLALYGLKTLSNHTYSPLKASWMSKHLPLGSLKSSDMKNRFSHSFERFYYSGCTTSRK